MRRERISSVRNEMKYKKKRKIIYQMKMIINYKLERKIRVRQRA